MEVHQIRLDDPADSAALPITNLLMDLPLGGLSLTVVSTISSTPSRSALETPRSSPQSK